MLKEDNNLRTRLSSGEAKESLGAGAVLVLANASGSAPHAAATTTSPTVRTIASVGKLDGEKESKGNQTYSNAQIRTL